MPDPDKPVDAKPTVELSKEAQAALEEYEASRKDPKPSKDHYGRWNIPYQALNKIRFSWLGKKLPLSMTTPLMYWMHLISIHDIHRRQVAGQRPYASSLDDFEVSADEHVRVPAIFLIELFPPSEIYKLERSLKKNRMNENNIRFFPNMTPSLNTARSGAKARWSWWPLGTFISRNSGLIVSDPIYGKLPDEFRYIDLKALQIGDGITAVMACFRLSDAGAEQLDQAWHSDYGPAVNHGKKGQWPQAVGPSWAAFRAVQETRASLHAVARRWFADICPGVFASNNEPQALIDVLIFDKLDAELEESPDRATHDRLRALGIPHTHTICRSPQFPKMALSPVDAGWDSDLDGTRAWGLWGQRDAVIAELKQYLDGLGLPSSDSGIIYYVKDAIEDYFLRIAIHEVLIVNQKRYAAVRDNARQRHGRFRKKNLKGLRSSLLTLSLDLASMDRDIREYNSRGWESDDAKFFLEEPPYALKDAAENGYETHKPINLNERMSIDQEKMLGALASADRDYRGILTSAAQLTSSMEALRTSRVALGIAVLSTGIASVGFLLADAATHTRLDAILCWLTSK